MYLIGQAIINVHLALVYCSDLEKQVIFAVVMTIWMLPIYTVIVFNGHVFMQFCRTISQNFKQLRHDIGDKSRQVKYPQCARRVLNDISTKSLQDERVSIRGSKYILH